MFKENIRSNITAAISCLIVILAVSWPSPTLAVEEVNTTFFGVAIKGYDTVAYSNEGRAVKGKRKFAHTWNDAKWFFSSDLNRKQFAADPEKYAPQYGGY